MTEKELKAKINNLLNDVDVFRGTLKEEQEDSEAAHADWERTDDEDEDEPDLIDNQDAIDRLEEAMNHLDEAQAALDD